MRITKFRVQIDAAGEELVGAKIILPHHGIRYSSSWSEAELWQWIRSTIKNYLREQARASVRAKARRLPESR